MSTEAKRVGPRKTCPACKEGAVSEPTYCAPNMRVWLGFKKLFEGKPFCSKEGRHLHQKCLVCKMAWTCTPAVAPKT